MGLGHGAGDEVCDGGEQVPGAFEGVVGFVKKVRDGCQVIGDGFGVDGGSHEEASKTAVSATASMCAVKGERKRRPSAASVLRSRMKMTAFIAHGEVLFS